MSTQCRFCGEAVRPDSMFCPSCGQLIGAVAGAVPPFPSSSAAPVPRDSPKVVEAPAIDPVPLPAPRRPASKQETPPEADAPPQGPPPAAKQKKPVTQKPIKKNAVEQTPPELGPVSITLPDGQRFALDRVIVLGRAPEQGAAAYNGVPVRLDDPERAMSRVHLVISPGSAGVTATDPGSANGTLLERAGAQYTLVAATATTLLPGDRLLLGDATLAFA
ncbi:MAG: hypothetical protein ACTH8F_00235 [Microbacterium sp.]|uniref:FHA domain-containing protein n=1 Tax=Microbacterium sp. TaxID=51671 RepID=UPI003F9DCAC7